MELRPFGSTGISVPVIGQGTWQVATRGDAASSVVRTLQRGLDLGMSHIDTAELYKGAEPLVAQAIAGRRESVFLVSKVLPRNASREGTVLACERSLKLLGTDHLDCYLHHWNDGSFPIEETMAGMRDLVETGKVRRVGVSNYDVDEMKLALRALGGIALACNQVLYHPEARAIERDVLPFCADHGIAVVGYTPFGDGAMFRPGTRSLAALDTVGRRHARTPRQIVLAYVTRHPALFAIPKASTLAHVEENAGGQGLAFSAADLEVLDRAFPVG